MRGDLPDKIARARAVLIADEVHRRRIPLRRVGAELVGACPVCGDGGKGLRSNRFAVHPRKNVWLCRHCSTGGDVIGLVMHLDGVGFLQAVAVLAGELALAPTSAPHAPVPICPVPAADGGARWALALWTEGRPLKGTLAERYLTEARNLVLPQNVSPDVLRFHPASPFAGVRHPCLLALYRDVKSDAPRAVMRTALTQDGRKIARRALGPLGGAAVKLSDDAEVTMGLTIGEGLETTLAAMMHGYVPAWAVGSAGAIAKFPVLSGIEALTILKETGDGGASERATDECARRWSAAGREVLVATSMVGGDVADTVAMAGPGRTEDYERAADGERGGDPVCGAGEDRALRRSEE